MRVCRHEERENKMSSMFMGGMTLAEIGKEYGVSRERVRQILKRMGVKPCEGGRAVRPKVARNRKKRASDDKYLRKWGCTKEQYDSLRRMDPDYWKTPIGRFISQRNNAKQRGIGWAITLWEWWMVWGESGMWERRGRNYGEYVMCRFGDSGPYSVDNVEIRPCNDNAAEATKGPSGFGICDNWKAGSISMARNPERIIIDMEENR